MKKILMMGIVLMMTSAFAFAQTGTCETGKKACTEKCDKPCCDKPCDKPCKKDGKDAATSKKEKTSKKA